MAEFSLDIIPLKALEDNYIYLVREPGSGTTGVVDPSEAGIVLEALKTRQWPLHFIFNTHHHWDHVAGNETLKKATGAVVISSAYDYEHHRIPGVDRGLREGECLSFGNLEVRPLDIPGHTLGHLAFWFPQVKTFFPGDTLFSIGCGRLFEGTAGQMWTSLKKIKALPDDTLIYCGHEYTASNLKFALSLEPESLGLLDKQKHVSVLRKSGLPTVPAILGEEKQLNPFLRADDISFAEKLSLSTSGPVKVFSELRRRKDRFLS